MSRDSEAFEWTMMWANRLAVGHRTALMKINSAASGVVDVQSAVQEGPLFEWLYRNFGRSLHDAACC